LQVGKVSGLYIYPVKSVSPHRLESVRVSPEQGFPFDRAFALARYDRGPGRQPLEPLDPEFHMLTHNARLAGLRTQCNPETGQFRAYVQEHLVLSCDLSSSAGRSEASRFFAAVLDLPDNEAPQVVRAEGHNYSYLDSSSCHIVNLASVRDLAERAGVQIDPLRFRANLYIDTDDPWSEFDWVGKEVAIGEEVRARPAKRAVRCAATEVNRVNALRDVPIPRLLKRFYGHTDFGVYATFTSGGLLEPGMAVTASVRTRSVPSR
jgi:uncharacterized protein YcbX